MHQTEVGFYKVQSRPSPASGRWLHVNPATVSRWRPAVRMEMVRHQPRVLLFSQGGKSLARSPSLFGRIVFIFTLVIDTLPVASLRPPFHHVH
jgi:hypothetical protein